MNYSTIFTAIVLYALTISLLLCHTSHNNLVEGLLTTAFLSRSSGGALISRTKSCEVNFQLYDISTTVSIADSKSVPKEKATNDNSPERIKISAGRFIVPGDYIVHEDYGIGRYLGLRYVHIAPASITPSLSKKERMKKSVPVVRVQYEDAEVTWFLKFAGEEWKLLITYELKLGMEIYMHNLILYTYSYTYLQYTCMKNARIHTYVPTYIHIYSSNDVLKIFTVYLKYFRAAVMDV